MLGRDGAELPPLTDEQQARNEARKAVQEKLAAARALIHEAELIMDKHRFSVEFNLGSEPWHAIDYIPRDVSKEERGYGGGIFWHGIEDEFKDGGVWLPSDTFGGC